MKFIKKTIKLGIIFSILGIFGVISLYICAYFSPVLDIKSTGQYYIYDNDNSLVFQGSGNSKWVDLSDVSPYFIDAIISTEDKNFYKHNGFDYLRIMKTLFLNVKKGTIVGGASTISQQYVKNLFLDFDKTWERKLEEAWLTLKLEVHYSKDDILEGYINTINFGQGNYGIEDAASFYFNKHAKDLTLEESIILSGIPKGPSYYNPLSNYDNAIKRAKVVATAMVNNKKIDETTKDNLFQNKLEIYGKRTENNSNTIMYYQDLVMKELESIRRRKMNIRLQIIIAIILIIALCVIVNMIRKKRLELRYALAWLIVGVGTLVLDCFPILTTKLAELIGVASPINMLFFLGFCFSLVIIFVLTVAISRVSIRMKQLTQELALYEKKMNDELKNR